MMLDALRGKLNIEEKEEPNCHYISTLMYCKNDIVWKLEATLICHWDSNWRFIVCIPTKY